MSAVLVALSFVPLLAVGAWHLRERRRFRAFEKARLAEVAETVDAYEAEEEVTARMSSFSGYPFQKRHR